MTTAEILRAAADQVRQGWCRGHRHDQAGNVCALGAITNAVFGQRFTNRDYLTPEALYAERLVPEVISALATHLPVRLEKDPFWSEAWRIAEWNNDSQRTAEDVATLMEFAALCEEQAAAVAQEATQAVRA